MRRGECWGRKNWTGLVRRERGGGGGGEKGRGLGW